MTGYSRIPAILTGYNGLLFCQSQAVKASATYFGLQFGMYQIIQEIVLINRYCFYGNPTSLTVYGPVRSDSECNIVCQKVEREVIIGPNW